MAEPMYFQWQNKYLLETIYPRRNRKLADFLAYCREIDLWEEYKDKDIAELQEEVAAYKAERDLEVITAYKSYKTEYAYFTNEDVRTQYAKYKLSDQAELAPIEEMHRAFQKYLPTYKSVRKEKNLIAWYVSVWQEKRKKLEQEATRLENKLKLPGYRDRADLTGQLQKLQTRTLPILNDELDRLVKFLSTYTKIEKRRQEFYKATESAKKEIQSVRTRLDGVLQPLRRLEAECRELSVALARLRTPPRPEAFEGYFTTDDVYDELCRHFPQADPALLDLLHGLHKRLASELRALKSPEVRRSRVGNFVSELRGHYNKLLQEFTKLEAQLRSLPEDSPGGEKQARFVMLRDAGLKAVEMELEKLSDYHAGLEHAQKPQAELVQKVREKETALKTKQDRLSALIKQVSLLEEELQAKETVLNMSEIDYLVRFVPDRPITVQDIVRGKFEAYKTSLEQKLDRKPAEKNADRRQAELEIQQELLEEIVQRFLDRPGEYPAWLQYMVIHFSGMRYATAHGSWADPKDLLISLRTPPLERDLKKLDDDTVEAMSEERVSVYESPDPDTAPKFALAPDPKSKARIAIHVKGLQSTRPYERRKALFDLRMDEEIYEIQSMTPAEALEELRARDLPDWMWKEIVRLTELRVQEANDPGWNKLTPEEQDQKNEARYAEFREVMNEWKSKHLTGWRQEHDRSNRLIVTSSVCNEVAEQVLHLRGRSPSGGLTGLVDWYMRIVREGKVQGISNPYFVFAKQGAEPYYKEGATLLWLRFVHEPPNAWRVAKPLEVGGDRLIPAKYLKGGVWKYFEKGEMVTRTRQRVVDKKRTVKEEQFLRWMHAATVARVGETVDGPIVLTFETALPYDDPGVSAVGVFKHSLHNLMWDGGEEYYNGSFIAYVPEGDVPESDLKEMLDWSRILRRQVRLPA